MAETLYHPDDKCKVTGYECQSCFMADDAIPPAGSRSHRDRKYYKNWPFVGPGPIRTVFNDKGIGSYGVTCWALAFVLGPMVFVGGMSATSLLRALRVFVVKNCGGNRGQLTVRESAIG